MLNLPTESAWVPVYLIDNGCMFVNVGYGSDQVYVLS